MGTDDIITILNREITDFISSPNAYRSVLILIVAIIISFIASKLLARLIIKLAQVIATKSDDISDRQKQIRYRQIETYLSITVAVVRGVVVAVVAYIVWRLISPTSTSGAAAIGASAFFIVFAGQTLGPLLRDVTTGSMMITEGWFHVGDFIRVEPFIEMNGVVERFTLRSTKLRSLSGEVIWVHNQHMQAVHVTSGSVRTYAIDIFTRDPDKAQEAIQEVIDAVPASTTLVRNPMKILSTETWNDQLSHMIVQCRVAPGREWVAEQFFINALKEIDEGRKKSERLIVYEPTARFADPTAERKFRRLIK